jgi:uncharacterized membrane protein
VTEDSFEDSPPQRPARRPFELELELMLVGIAMWLMLGSLFVFLWLVDTHQARGMMITLGTELAFGREAGIPAGLAAGFNPFLAWAVSVGQDFATAFLAYPIFLFILHKFHDRDVYIMRRLRRIEAKAAEHEEYVERWGPLGIAVFMLLPFMLNGPFVALILGRLTGIPTRHLLLPVVLATIIVAGAWTFAVDAMLTLANSVDERVGYWAVGITVVVIATLGVVDFLREHRASKLES